MNSFTIQFENIGFIFLGATITTITSTTNNGIQEHGQVGDGAPEVTVTKLLHVRTRRRAQVQSHVVIVDALRATRQHVSDPHAVGATVQDADRGSLTNFQWPRQRSQ